MIMEFKPGVYTVMPTFFKESEVDIDQLVNAIKIQIASGIKNIVLLGTTSETPTLTNEEQEKIVQTVWENFKGQVNIVVGIGGNNTKVTLENAFKFRHLCDAFMVTVPYYNKPSQEGIYQHFSTIAKNTKLPILLYNIPGRSGASLDVATIKRLGSDKNIVGIKEASGSADIISSMKLELPNSFQLYCGDDALTLPCLENGAKGVVSVASHCIGIQLQEMVSFFHQNDFIEAEKIHKKYQSLFSVLFITSNPVPVKAALRLMSIDVGSVRLPLVDVTEEEKEKIKDVLQQLDLI